ncbi:MAG: MCE family protein [Bacteroidetes bacterium]|nr:MCE family protein [Bacteroidota bacterium]MCW5894838.1 MCE family protein [Bacteroidota bacterium]
MAKINTSPTGGVGWRNLRTGILFVAGLILAGILGLVIGKNTNILTRHDTAYLFISSIKGLSEGNMVAVSGKKIGVVKSMDFSTRNDTTGVLVTLDITRNYFGLITSDSKATIKALGVLGDKFVDITLGQSKQMLPEGGFLDVVAEPGLEDLIASAIQTMDTIQVISQKISKGEGTIGRLITSTELNDKLLKTAANVEAMTKQLTSGEGLAARLINDKQMAGHVSSLITNLSDVTTSLKEGKGTLGKLIVDESFYNNLSSVIRRSDSLFSRLNDPSNSLGKLTNDDELYRHIDHSILSLDSLLMDFKQNPGRYVKVSVF